MTQKMIAMFTAVTAALLVVSVAWAGSEPSTEASVIAADDTSTSIETTATSEDDPAPTSSAGDSTSTSQATSTSVGDTTSTSLADGTTSTSIASTTSTSNPGTTSTSGGSSTSTSLDDSDVAPPDGLSTYSIGGVGSVTIEVSSGRLSLVSVTAPGWQYEIEKAESDRIEIEFSSGEAEAEFEARIRHGRIDVETKVDSD